MKAPFSGLQRRSSRTELRTEPWTCNRCFVEVHQCIIWGKEWLISVNEGGYWGFQCPLLVEFKWSCDENTWLMILSPWKWCTISTLLSGTSGQWRNEKIMPCGTLVQGSYHNGTIHSGTECAYVCVCLFTLGIVKHRTMADSETRANVEIMWKRQWQTVAVLITAGINTAGVLKPDPFLNCNCNTNNSTGRKMLRTNGKTTPSYSVTPKQRSAVLIGLLWSKSVSVIFPFVAFLPLIHFVFTQNKFKQNTDKEKPCNNARSAHWSGMSGGRCKEVEPCFLLVLPSRS